MVRHFPKANEQISKGDWVKVPFVEEKRDVIGVVVDIRRTKAFGYRWGRERWYTFKGYYVAFFDREHFRHRRLFSRKYIKEVDDDEKLFVLRFVVSRMRHYVKRWLEHIRYKPNSIGYQKSLASFLVNVETQLAGHSRVKSAPIDLE